MSSPNQSRNALPHLPSCSTTTTTHPKTNLLIHFGLPIFLFSKKKKLFGYASRVVSLFFPPLLLLLYDVIFSFFFFYFQHFKIRRIVAKQTKCKKKKGWNDVIKLFNNLEKRNNINSRCWKERKKGREREGGWKGGWKG